MIETLDEVHEAISKYSKCNIIWTGDINTSTDHPNPTSNDKRFDRFCKEDSLRVSQHMPWIPIFYHLNDISKSTIDLFII